MPKDFYERRRSAPSHHVTGPIGETTLPSSSPGFRETAMRQSIVRISGALLCSFFLVACGNDSNPVDPPGGGTGGGTGGRVVKANPSFQSDIIEIFNRRGCSAGQCHGTAPGSANLLLTTNAAFSNLVGVTAVRESNFERVVAGDADNSYLVIKLEGRQTSGARMPLGATPLDNTDLTNIKNWINSGAPNN